MSDSDWDPSEVPSDLGDRIVRREQEEEEEEEGARGRSGSEASSTSLEGLRRHQQEAEEAFMAAQAAEEAAREAEAEAAEARAEAAQASAAAAEAQRAKKKKAPPRPDDRLVVGDRVVLRPGADGEGHMSPGDIGVVCDADNSSLPYHVEFKGRKHWYRKDQVELYDASEVRVTAYEVQFDGRKWWYAEKALSKHPDSPTPVEAPLSVGDLVTLTREYRSEPDAANGVLWPGAVGKVVACHVVVGGRTWWYDKDDQEAIRDHVAALGVPRITAKSKVNLWVGDKVVLADNYADFGEAAEGPLAPGDVGEIVACDNSHLPYMVQFEGSTWFYAAGAIEKYEPPARGHEEDPIQEGVWEQLDVGDRDVAKEGGGGDGRQAPEAARRRESSASGSSLAPSAPTEDLRIVVSGCQDSKLNGTYVRKGNRTWRGKPLYVNENDEDFFLYWSSRDGQKEGWNLGPSDTRSWVYYAPGGSHTVPPKTGWTAKDGSTSGLPKVRFKGGQVKGGQAQRNGNGGGKADVDGPAPTSCKAGERYRFVPTGSYRYDSRCIQGEVVEVMAVTPGNPPAHVKWPDGFTYWVHYEDLRTIVPQAKTLCPQGHPLEGFTTPHDFVACDSDACRGKAPKPEGAQMYGCRRCNYDLCVECMGKAQAAAAAAAPAANAAAATPLPEGWVEYRDPASGNPYYHNASTNTTVSERPQEQKRAKPPPRNSAPQVLKRKEVGLRVRRGPDWRWGNQDGGEGKLGTTCDDPSDGWIQVRWDHGDTYSYRVGAGGHYDLVIDGDEGQQAAEKGADSKELRIHVQGAGGRGRGCNGVYKQVRTHMDHPLFKKVGGEAIIFWAGWWKMADEDDPRGWYYGVDGNGQLPPEGRWTTKGADGLGADPPPIVSIEAAGKLNDSAASPSAIKVGDSVQVSEKVSEPAYGWGQVRHKIVGTVVQDYGEDVEVDFPGQSGWRGKRSELEKVGGNDQPEEADPKAANVGDWVRVSESVSEPHYGWGDVKHKMVGIVVKQQGDDLKVDFPDHKGWTGKRSELEKISANDAPQVASSGPIRVGDLVRVSEKVSEPAYGWGRVKPKMVGRVSKDDGDDVEVDFPTQKGWSGKRSELEKLAGGDGAPSESCAVAPLVVGDEVVLVSAYKRFGDAASGPLSPGDRGKIVSASGCRLNVSFNRRTWWYDPAALRRPGDLVVQAETPSAAIKVGDKVRVSPSVTEPKFHWGGVKHGMVGEVTGEDGDVLRIKFPGVPRWHGMRDEMEKVVPDDQATPVCPQGHTLTAFVTTAACSCKSAVCRGKAEKPKGEKMYNCRLCSYELCPECFAQAGKGGAVPTSAQVGEKYMFVRTSSHNYVSRCTSEEVVEVVAVAEAGASSPLPVQVKWPSGFTHGAHFEDLRHLDGLPLRGDKVLETAGVKEHFYWAFCAGGVIRDSGREFLKVDTDPGPATGSTGPARVVVSECGDWTYDGVYVLKEDKDWNDKPLYEKGAKEKFCYWADRGEMGEGWNLGTNETAVGWAYFAKTTSETPPTTGWKAKDGQTTGLPKVTFIPGSSMVTKGVRALGPLPDDATWQVEFTGVGSHWAAGVATVEAQLTGSAYLLGNEDVRESWAACFDKSGKALARHRGHERELKDYKYVQPSLQSSLSGALSGGLADLLGLGEKLGLKERGAPFELKFWRRNGRTLVVQLPGESKERVLFTNLGSEPLYAVAATAKVGSSVRLKGQDSDVKVVQPESEDESEAWCSSPGSSCGKDEREERAREKMEIAKLRRAAAKRRKQERRKAEAEAARKVLEKGFRNSALAWKDRPAASVGEEKQNVNVEEKVATNAEGRAEAMQNVNGDGEAEETRNLNGEAEASNSRNLDNSGGKNLKKAMTYDTKIGEAFAGGQVNELLEEQVNSKLSATGTLAMSEEMREAALNAENHEGLLTQQDPEQESAEESKVEKEEAALDPTGEKEEAALLE